MGKNTEATVSKSNTKQKLLVKQLNTTLKDELHCKVTIGIDRNSVYIQYSDSERQRKISPPSVSLSTQGIHRAFELAKIIDNALRSGLYDDSWLKTSVYGIKPDKPKELLCGEAKSQFSERWLESRKGDKSSTDRQKKVTLDNYLQIFNRAYKLAKIKDSDKFDEATIEKLLNAFDTAPNRARLTVVINLIIKFWKLKLDIELNTKKPKAVIKRDIPTDEQVIDNFHKLSEISKYSKRDIDFSLYYQWCYGIIATYGLRPQEIFAIDWNKSFKLETDNWLFLNGIQCDGIKTGDRAIVPLLTGWVDLFNLADPPPVYLSIDNTGKLKSLVSDIAEAFKRVGLGQPYDIRHAWGIRSKRFLNPIDAACCMGHSLEVHMKTYHSHESFDSKLASVRESMKQRGY